MTQKKTDENLGSFYMGRMRRPPEPERRLPRGFLTVVTVLAFGGVIWYAYPQGGEKYTDMPVPLVKADTTPYTSKPENPGGMEIRHQDSTVFDTLAERPVVRPEKIVAAPTPTKLVIDAKKPELNFERQMPPEPVKTSVKGTASTPVSKPAEEKPKLAPATGVEARIGHDSIDPSLHKRESLHSQTGGLAHLAAAPLKESSNVPIKTAEKTPAARPMIKTTVAGGKVYIQIGSYRSLDSAAADWKRLQHKYPQYLKSLSMKTQRADIPEKGTYYRLQAGTLAEVRAKDICADLSHIHAGGCIVVK